MDALKEVDLSDVSFVTQDKNEVRFPCACNTSPHYCTRVHTHTRSFLVTVGALQLASIGLHEDVMHAIQYRVTPRL